MPKEIFFRHEQPVLTALPVEEAIHEASTEYPRVKSDELLDTDLGTVRLIRVSGGRSQAKALYNFKYLSDTELKPILPAFIYPLNLTDDDHMLVINEFAQDDFTVTVRTIGANNNIYTGSTKILDEAELYSRQHGVTDKEGHGRIGDLEAQGEKIAQLLSRHSLTARMSAFSVVVRKTNDPQNPFQAELKLRDLSQVTRQAGKLSGYPIWGIDCFYGMLHTISWWHKKR
jgi:hypothetical protein